MTIIHEKKRSAPGFFRSWRLYRQFKKLARSEKTILFFAESGQDWHHFSPVINHLTGNLSQTVCYVSSDPDDPGLLQENERIKPFFIREGLFQILFFSYLKADILVLTMLDLNNFHLKRSVNPVHYIYLFHAMGSTHMVDFANSYDHYDTIFCVGPHQKEEIRKREQLKGLPPKNLVDHGYARLDSLMEKNREYERTRAPHGEVTVLLAPTWGDSSILNTCGLELCGVLLGEGFRLILRPHYETVKRTPQVVADIRRKFGHLEAFSYVDKMGENPSLFQSDLLISDWSSMSIEYALGLEKPVLFIDVPRRVRNPDYMELGIEPVEVRIRKEVGDILSPRELEKAPFMIRSILEKKEEFKEKIDMIRRRYLFNPGESARIGALEILRIKEHLMDHSRTGRPA